MYYYVWLLGGYFNNSCYGRFKEEDLPGDEILMHHYDNPVAKMQGITILGITKKGPDDITIVERYVRSSKLDNQVSYTCKGEVDPEKVQMVGEELYFKPEAEDGITREYGGSIEPGDTDAV
jgi:hypothetical protein